MSVPALETLEKRVLEAKTLETIRWALETYPDLLMTSGFNLNGTVLVDLPTNWTNWSLSLLARSDLVLLVTQMTIPSLNRAKRQLELMRAQELEDLDVRIVVNRLEKGFMRTIRLSDVRDGLGLDVSYTIANDHALMRSAIDRGVPIDEIKRKSAIGKNLDMLDAGIAAALRLGR